MLRYNLYKLARNPLRVIWRAIYERLIAPHKYAVGQGYNARKYWSDRLGGHGK